jgi:hypothetical protein
MFSPSNDHELLKQTSYSTGNLLLKLVDYIEKEFKTSRVKATFAAGVLIASLPEMIEENEGGREGVQEIIDDFENIQRKHGFTSN